MKRTDSSNSGEGTGPAPPGPPRSADPAAVGAPEGSAAEEAELVRRAQASDPWAVDRLLRRYQKKVYAIAYQLSGFDGEEARDAAQEALLQVFRNIAQFEGRSRFSTWVHRVTVNSCLDAKRRRRRWLRMILPSRADGGDREGENEFENIPAPQEDTDPVAVISGAELRRDVTRALERLSEHQRIVFKLKVFQDMSIPEIAEVTGMAEGTVKSHLFRATRSVRDQLHAWTRREGKGGDP